MKTFADNLKKENPNNFSPTWTLKVRTLDDLSSGRIRGVLLVLLGAVGFVLLIACANVANLLLARAAVRMKEIAIRSALGADRASLVRQLLTESVLLALAGGVLGLLLAQWSVKSLVALNPNLPRASEIGIDASVMVFTLVVSVVTGLLFGLAPALQTSRTNLQETLKDGSAQRRGRLRRPQRAPRARRRRSGAVAHAARRRGTADQERDASSQGVDPGFDPRNVLMFNLALPGVKYPTDTSADAVRRAVDAAAQRARRACARPERRRCIPFGGGWSTASFAIEGLTVPPGQNGPWGDIRMVTPRFFEALRIPLKKGRAFTDQDRNGAPPRRHHRRAIREEVLREHRSDRQAHHVRRARAASTDSTWITIVGVVGHAAHEGLDAEPRIQYYFPYAQVGGQRMVVAIRTDGNPTAVLAGGARRRAQHRSQLAALEREDDGAARRRLGRPAQAVDDPARRVLGHRAAARVDRHLRRDELLRRAAHARARHSHGARRGADERARSRRRPGHGARRRRSGDRTRSPRSGSRASLTTQLYGVERDRSGDVRARVGAARRRRAARHAAAGDARDARRSGGGAARRVVRNCRSLATLGMTRSRSFG